MNGFNAAEVSAAMANAWCGVLLSANDECVKNEVDESQLR